MRDGVVAAVVVDGYPGGRGQRDRAHLGATADKLLVLAQRLGFRAAPLRNAGAGVPGVRAGTTREEIMATVGDLRRHPARRKILYWTGHGEKTGQYYLACRDSYRGARLDPGRSVAAAELASWLAADSADILLILDACFSGRALDDVLHVIRESGRPPDDRGRPAGFAVVATAAEDQTATEGQWVAALEDVLATADLDLDGHRLFHREVPFLPFVHVMDAITEHMGWSAPQRPVSLELRPLRPSFLDNPYCSETARPATRPPDDETWIGEELGDGVLPVYAQGEESWELRDFSPRDSVLGTLVGWLATRTTGLLAVTGASGAGKSALLTYLARLTTRQFSAALAEEQRPRVQPELYSIHAALHCRGKTVLALCEELLLRLAPLGPPAPGPPPAPVPPAASTAQEEPAAGAAAPVTPDTCVKAVADLAARKGSLTLLFDGLDEAAAGHSLDIARSLLNGLAAKPGVKVLVGTRAGPRRRLPGELPQETLLDALHSSLPCIELDRLPETGHDIARHVERLLARTGTPLWRAAAAERREAVARHVAAHSNGLFLVATLWARHLARRAAMPSARDLDGELRTGVAGLNGLLARELELLDPGAPVRMRDILRPLALAQGRGLPQPDVWLAMANAVRAPGSREYTGDDLRLVIGAATGVVIGKDSESARDVYRLHHPSFGAHLVDGAAEPRELHCRVYEALRPPPGTPWEGVDAYVTGYLAAHAALAGGGALDDLVRDDAFVVHASPDVLEPLVATQLRAAPRPTLYLRVAGAFRTHTAPAARWTLLRATALATAAGEGLLRTIPHPAELFWDDVWSDADALPLQRSWPGPNGGAYAVCWAGSGDGLVHAAGSGEIRTWAADGRQARSRDTGSGTWRTPTALRGVSAAGDGPELTVAAHDGRTVFVWQGGARQPAEQLYWGGTPGWVSVARLAGTVYLAGVDEGLWIWRWPGGQPLTRQDVHALRVPGPAHCAVLLPLRDTVLAVAGGPGGVALHDVTRRPSRPGRYTERVALLPADRPVRAVAALAAHDGPGVWLASLDGEHLHVWHAAEPVSAFGPDPVQVAAERSAGRTVALGRGPRGLMAAVREDGDVRVWDVPGGEHTPLPGSSHHHSLAFDPSGSGRLAVADETRVRIWEPPAAEGAGRQAGGVRRGRVHVRLAEGPRGEHLLCRAHGSEVHLSLHRADGPVSAPPRPLRHDRPITALTAARVPLGWLVAAVGRRSAAVWLVPHALDRVPADPSAAFALHGQDDMPVPSAHLVARAGGGAALYAPGKQCVRAWECAAQTYDTWREAPAPWPFTAAATARQVGVRTAPDGLSWLYAWGGDAGRVWRLPDRGRATHRVDRAAVRAAAFGVARVGDRFAPLVALAVGDRVEVAVCLSGESMPEYLEGPASPVDALVLTGPPERPLLVGWRKGSGRLHLWDVAARAHLRDVEDRGYPVETVAAVHDEAGVTLLVQGRDQGRRVRCDQVLLPARRLAGMAGRGGRQ